MVQLKIADVLGIFTRGLDHIDRRLIDHGARVAYIVYHMLKVSDKFDDDFVREVTFIALMHDIGAYKTEEIDKMLEFESTNIWEHSVYGYLFIDRLTPFSKLAPAILFHHTDYETLRLIDAPYKDVAQIINLADRADTYIHTKSREGMKTAINRTRGTRFSSEAIDLFYQAQEQCHFIEQIMNDTYKEEFGAYLGKSNFSNDKISDFLKTVMYVIDFRSVFTVTHTITTMGISDELGRLMGLHGEEVEKLHIGAQLHDLGKISIPIEILEKPGKLTSQEMDIMRTHVDITEEIIGSTFDEVILQNAIRHHEKLDGSGYPRGLVKNDLTLSQRIIAVADIISALKGRRSYKDSYPKEKILMILYDMANNGKICPEVTAVIIEHYETIMDNVRIQCGPAIELYESINAEYETLRSECGTIVS